jgi:hypothetical protein
MSLRTQLGALVYDWPRFLRHIGGDWELIRNRDERLESDGRGVVCQWEFSSELHIARVSPFAARWLFRRAFADWPITRRDAPERSDAPEVSFIIGHRGLERLPNLLETLRGIAGQTGAATECIVVEQSASREIETRLPSWVHYVHTPVPDGMPYCRSATFNAGANLARGQVLILHDNDILVPERYAAEVLARTREGAGFVDLKRFLFYLSPDERLTSIEQNLQGGSIAATRDAYAAIGGFDEGFVGWGGEDNDFRERAHALGGVYAFGYLPMIHLWHAPQPGKRDLAAPAVRRYWEEIRHIPAEERIRRLRGVESQRET